jgi:PKD repeat protein
MKLPIKKFKFYTSIICVTLFLFSSLNSQAQESKEIIKNYIQVQAKDNSIDPKDFTEWILSDEYTDKGLGITHAYMQQMYHGIPIFNAISVVAIKDSKVAVFRPGIAPYLNKRVKTDVPTLSPEEGVNAALACIKKKSKNLSLIEKDEIKHKYTYTDKSISVSPIEVQLMYVAKDDKVLLSWNVSVELIKEPHWWNIRVDAVKGKFIEKNDFTRSCNFGIAPASAMAPPPPAPFAPDYSVFAYPIEAPTFGSRALISNPSDPIASPYGWHDIDGVGGAEYTITRGNNVHAYEDRNNDNLPGYSPDGTSNLVFDSVYSFTNAPLLNQHASVTNLFYLNNYIHDYLYRLGFDEVSGNFQQNNYGNGGLGSDYVNAEGFDGGGTNNANFSTPADGSKPRMQMYLFNSTTPNRDGSFDNGIVAHEFGHGVSNRLTGGPSQASCLSNAEQGGEGWSDWLALMLTIKPGDVGATPRGMGTYATGQATNGTGIRRYPYSTDMTINPQNYANIANTTSGSQVHNMGEIWCDVLWDMSWLLMDQFGYSSDPTIATAGNNIAINLVLQGMKLQPCNPGFLDARNAILAADSLIYGYSHKCLIWQAFARRGMGWSASQGSANVAGDETAAFNIPNFCVAVTQAPVSNFTASTVTPACGGNVSFTDQSTQAQSWLWYFGDNTTSTAQNPSKVYTSPGTYTVSLVVTNTLGIDSLAKVSHITVAPTFTTTITNTPMIGCSGDPVQLTATPSVTNNNIYNVSNIPYAPVVGVGIGATITLTDDQMSAALPIGFTFSFFGNNYTNFYKCSNGYITFTANQTSATTRYGVSIPTAATPNNFIAAAWSDLNPVSTNGSKIRYITTGTAPNRKLIINDSTFHFGGTAYPMIVQTILYETSNIIEVHTSTITNTSPITTTGVTKTITQGIENSTGSKGYFVPGRNSAIFSTNNDAYRFTPGYSYLWTTGNLNGATQTFYPTSASGTVYDVTVSDGTCTATFSSPVINVYPKPTVTINASSQSVCSGNLLTLTATGANNLVWTGGVSNGVPFIPIATSKYIVTGTDANGCIGKDSITVPVSNCLNTDLANLSISSGLLSPSFVKTTLNYTSLVANNISSINITPTADDALAALQIRINNGTYSDVLSGSAASITGLNVGNNAIDIRVTARDNVTTKVYTIIVNRSAYSNTNLSNINLIGAPYSPLFNSDTLTYSSTVLFGVNKVKVSPIVSDSSSRIKIIINNGAYVNIKSKDTSDFLALNIGSNTIYIKVEVQDSTMSKIYTIHINRANAVPPSAMNYSPNSINAIRTISSINIIPTYSGDSVTFFQINPLLPSGLTFNNLTGRISGTPLVLSAQTNYTITGVNNGGNTSTIFSLSVVAVAPSNLKYSDSVIIATRTITNISSTASASGDLITKYRITPSLPTGIKLDSTTGKIIGIASVLSPLTTYTITGSNTGGSATASFTLSVNAIAPSNLRFSDSSVVATRTLTNINANPTNSGDLITKYTIDPALPIGLNIDSVTGEISGTPQVISPFTTYNILGSNSGGFALASFKLTVNAIAPSNLNYTDSIIIATRTLSNINNIPTNAGDLIAKYNISPALPIGLSLDTVMGTISGIPLQTSPFITYIITGTNSGGSTTTNFSLTVNSVAPSNIIYNDSAIVATRLLTYINAIPNYLGDSIDSYHISPALPAGVSLDSITGTISGTPSQLMPLTLYTITGSNSGGSANAIFSLTVKSIAPSTLKYSDSNMVATRTISNINSNPIYVGDSITLFNINPSLPMGVNLDSITGKISGIPTVLSPLTTYTITGTNSGGTTNATIKLIVKAIAPNAMSYAPSLVIATNGLTNISSSPSYTGDSITSFSIAPAFPSGISLNTSTGLISGIPSVVSAQTLYTITGSNTGGSTNATFTLTVNKGTGINETDLVSTAIYPNPSTGIVNISSNQAIENIEVYDVTGKLVLSHRNDSHQRHIELDLSAFSNGIYFIQTHNQNAETTLNKVVISK